MRQILSIILWFAATCAHTQTSGLPDMNFGAAGKVFTNLGQSEDIARQVVVLPDAKIVVAGNSYDGEEVALLIARLDSLGAPDPEFGQNGLSRFEKNGFHYFTYTTAIQPDGKILIAGEIRQNFFQRAFVLRLLQNGQPDPDFGFKGFFELDQRAAFRTILVLPDHKILLGGEVSDLVPGGYTEGLMMRLLPNGTADNTFGNAGMAILTLGPRSDYLYQLHALPDGNILATGFKWVTPGLNYGVVLRLRPDGTIDSTYANSGQATYGILGFNVSFFSSVLLPDGKLVLGGTIAKSNKSDLLLVRLLPGGLPDSSFGVNGRVVRDAGSAEDHLSSLAIGPDGFFTGVGGARPLGYIWQSVITRYSPEGKPDNTFGDQGLIISNVATGERNCYGVALQPDGKAVIAGYMNDAYSFDFTISRITSTGQPDSLFGTFSPGISRINFPAGNDRPANIALDTYGHIYVAHNAYGNPNEAFVVKYEPGGGRDKLFGINGVVRIPEPLMSYRFARVLALKPDHKVTVAGQTPNGDTLSLWQCDALTGAPDPEFGPGGVLELTIPQASGIRPTGLQFLSDGRMLICGQLSIQGQDDQGFSLRLLPDGVPDSSWGQHGIALVGNSWLQHIHAQKVLKDGSVLLCGSVWADSAYNFDIFLARLTPEGLPDQGFGIAGRKTIKFYQAQDAAWDLAIDNEGRILVAATNYNLPDQNSRLLVLRLLPNGNEDIDFGINGRLFLPDIGQSEFIFHYLSTGASIALQQDGKILVAGPENNTSGQSDIILYRLLPDGSMDTGFGIDGFSTTDCFGFNDLVSDMVIQTDNKLLVAGFAYNGDEYDAVLLRYLSDLSIGVKDLEATAASLFIYPNPLRNNATLRLVLPEAGDVIITLESASGTWRTTLFCGKAQQGQHEIPLHFDNESPSGWYICKIDTAFGRAVIRVLRI